MNLSPPTLAGFDVKSLLGRGGMSTVWEAWQLAMDRDVAIKVLDPAMSCDAEDVKRFVVEARLAAKLNHANLVRVFDVANQSGLYFYIMELVRGYDAVYWLRHKGRIDALEALSVAESIAVALEYAWNQVGLIHCDIKPANIMVHADGTVKLTDLGVARSLRGHAKNDDETVNDITGTPAYMAPEQVTGAVPLDIRTDMYALGATLYHLVTGSKLFPVGRDEELMELQCSGQAPDARDLVPELDEPYVALLEKLLAKDPARRPRSWSAALQDMRLVRQGRLPTGEPLPTGGSSMKRRCAAAELVTDDDDPQPTAPARCRSRWLRRLAPARCRARLLNLVAPATWESAPRWMIILVASAVSLIGFLVALCLLRLFR